MKALLPLLILSTVTLLAAIGIVMGLRMFQPQLFGANTPAPTKPAQPDSVRAAAQTVKPATDIKSDSTSRPQNVVALQGIADSTRLADSLRALTARIEVQMQTIAELQAKVQSPVPHDSLQAPQVPDSAQAKNAKAFAKMLETMPAEQAVRILKGLDDKQVKAILLSVKKRQAAKILAALEPDRAARMIR